jgi:peptidoglycan hydrolase-like protein with peptidoglycan-binding domain
MRSVVIAAAIAAAATPLAAQPLPVDARPEQRAPNPAMDAAQAAFDALPEAVRKQVQDDLIWASNFTATTSGQHGPRTHAAIINFQRNLRLPPNGILDDAQRKLLNDVATRARAANRLAIQADPRTGASLPIAGALFVKRETLPTGTRWESADGEVVLETGVGRGGAEELPAAFDRFVNLQAPGRRVTYKLLRPDFFVVSGDIGNRSFYVRYAVGPNNLRGYALSYPAARAKAMERHVIAIANGFQAVPGAPAPVSGIAGATQPNAPPSAIATQPVVQAASPAVLPAGLILTGVVTAPGKVRTAAVAAACPDLRVNGKPARLAQPGGRDAPAELEADTAGARPLAATAARAEPGSDVVVVGFAAGQRPALSVTPATIATATPALRIIMPLPREGGGALVFDRRGNLLGQMSAPRAAPRLVAGFVPAPSHAALPVAAVLPGTGTTAGISPEKTAGAIAAAAAPSLVAITCGQPVTLPKE